MKKQVDKELILAARKELKKRAASIDLANFITYTYPEYKLGWFHAEVCRALDQFLQDVIQKKRPRLILCAPPRSGKSEIVSRRFPAYMLGRYPDLSFIGTSYSSDLAGSFSKDVQRIMEEESFREVFPNVQIPMKGVKSDGAVRQADRFEIIGHRGSYYSVGVGGSLTGRGADVLIVDDPVSNMQDAMSERVRNSVWDWYTSTAYTRLSPGAGLIVMATRWSMDDLIGRLLMAQETGEGDNWKVINFPAIAETDEPHRKIGEALHPERFSVEDLTKIRQSVGERVWAALYQQHPVPDGGGLFKSDWLQFWTPDTLPAKFDTMVMSWDMTFKETQVSDFVVGQVWGRYNANFYLLDQVRARMDFVKTREAFIALSEKWKHVKRKLVEDKANGPAIISALKDKITGIIPITPKESKEARAASVTTLFEAGNVYLPPPDLYPWVKSEFIPELLSFPAGVHDDQVDACTQALSDLHLHTGWKVSKSNMAALRAKKL
nr:MAG TPA: Large Terminase [Caudoviricetes sp.]